VASEYHTRVRGECRQLLWVPYLILRGGLEGRLFAYEAALSPMASKPWRRLLGVSRPPPEELMSPGLPGGGTVLSPRIRSVREFEELVREACRSLEEEPEQPAFRVTAPGKRPAFYSVIRMMLGERLLFPGRRRGLIRVEATEGLDVRLAREICRRLGELSAGGLELVGICYRPYCVTGEKTFTCMDGLGDRHWRVLGSIAGERHVWEFLVSRLRMAEA